MSLVRILVDGYSLLHNWPELAPGCPRHSARAREALIRKLTHYQDAVGTAVTVFFDGQGAPSGTPQAPSTREVEILYSRSGQTADEMIERAAHRFQAYGQVLAVTDDTTERDVVIGLGGMVQGCLGFISTVNAALAGMTVDVQKHNRAEQRRYRRSTRNHDQLN